MQKSPTFEALSPNFGSCGQDLLVEQVGQLGHADGPVALLVRVAVVPFFLLEKNEVEWLSLVSKTISVTSKNTYLYNFEI